VKLVETDLPGVSIVEPKIFEDSRGFFLESYNQKTFSDLGIKHQFVQDNHSRSVKGVLRGLHYQLGKLQAKIVRVLQGEIYDVAVDIRVGSPTFGKWTAQVLSGENKRMLYIPEGFAHGFYVFSDMAEFEYKCSDFYAPQEERGIVWNDPELAIPWPLGDRTPILSVRDKKFGNLATRPKKDLPIYQP